MQKDSLDEVADDTSGYIGGHDIDEEDKNINTKNFIKMSIGDQSTTDKITLEGGHVNVQRELMRVSTLSNATDVSDMYINDDVDPKTSSGTTRGGAIVVEVNGTLVR